ncbi:MAG TPA: Zn-dependent hydrolase, partial [Thermoanaerobaculia bacterium]|nr:Zn-dependent hydrolase [Thermoanaerobaculia bacterium]
MTKFLPALLSLALLAATPYDPSKVVPDLDQRIQKFQKVDMPFSMEDLSPAERKTVNELIAASRDLEQIYWRQNNPEDIELYKETAKANPALHHYIWINGSRFEQINENKPFYGTEPIPPGRNLYPQGLTRDDIEAYVKAHPAQKKAIYDERTVVKLVSRNPLQLTTTPYHVEYKQWLVPAAQHLRNAAAATPDKTFAKFLRGRAKALLDDNYYPSDLVWVGEMKDPKIDIIFAPYETYLDDILGVKGSFGAAVMIRNEAESKKLAMFQQYVPDIQEALPLAKENKPDKHGQPTPMEVMDTPYRAGDLLHGYQAVADNLPNDPRIHEQKGTKK